MRYGCKECNFYQEGTSHTFDNVREHEKTHLQNDQLKTSRIKIK